MLTYNKFKPILSAIERIKVIKDMINGKIMEKPIRPKKPKFDYLSPPGNVITILGYPWENKETHEVKFYNESTGSKKWDNDSERQDFLNQWVPLDTTNIELLTEFALAIGVDTKDVIAVPYNNEWDGNPMIEYRAIKCLTKEEFKEKNNAYINETNRRNDLIRTYERKLYLYKQNKAKWDIFSDKAKVEKLKNENT